jgi:hypothetical protein
MLIYFKVSMEWPKIGIGWNVENYGFFYLYMVNYRLNKLEWLFSCNDKFYNLNYKFNIYNMFNFNVVNYLI